MDSTTDETTVTPTGSPLDEITALVTKTTRKKPTPMTEAEMVIPELPPWTGPDYHSFLPGSGAEKLADSGVAPLIAASRGYTQIFQDNFVEEMKVMGVKMTSKQGRRLKSSVNVPNKDAMKMPWYSAADIQIANRDGKQVTPFTYQLRPSHPEVGDDGKVAKYEFLANLGTPLDIHPATPIDWIDGAPVVMIAEGMLKGDSALSAYLHNQGIPYESLAAGAENPTDVLRELMAAIPVEERILIISIAGIYNIAQNPADWREINLKNRIGWIAFDADLADNPFVFQAAVGLHRRLEEKSKMSEVLFLNPQVTEGDDGSMSKMGVDDYLAKVGSWESLMKMITPQLPEPPKRSADERAGNWRIAPNGLSSEECFAVNEGPGGTLSGFVWRPALDLGGRIIALESRRQPTDQENRTGLFNPKVETSEVDDATVEIEVSWSRGHDSHSCVVSGPKSILNYSPTEWDRKGADIPDDLLLHPSWPPRAAKGESWLSAIKAKDADETARKTRWMQMGWMPVEGGEPVFLVGDTVIGDPEVTASAVAGINESNLSVAAHFGVGEDLSGDWDDEDYKEKVRTDFRKVMDAYVTAKPWTDEATAAVVLAGALRPTIPLRPRASILVWGPKGLGKSWTAQAMMYFWARHKSDWVGTLPGSAKDTIAFLEMVVSQAPIWVVDDLAPSASKRQSELENAKLEDLIRNIFNNASKGRMNADMTSRKINKPVAQLILTAENELTTPSVKERLVPVYLGKGKLNPDRKTTKAIDKMTASDGTQARLTAHVLKYVRSTAIAAAGGWEGYVIAQTKAREGLQGSASRIMEKRGMPPAALERTTSLAADLMLTLNLLGEMAQVLNMDEEFCEQFSVEDGLQQRIVELVMGAHAANQSASPGRSLLRALSNLLASGEAHVVSGENPSLPPINGENDTALLTNHRLGWKAGGAPGDLRPGGPVIGTVLTHQGNKVILFDTETAFAKAQDAYPTLIAHGQGTGSAWTSIWDEQIAPDYITRRKNTTTGAYLNTSRVGVGSARISGVPIAVDVVISGSMSAEDLADSGSDIY